MCASVAFCQTNVLFVGNSFTHGHAAPVNTYNNGAITDLNKTHQGGVPGIFKKLTVQAGLDINVSIETVSGKTLAYHLDKKSALITRLKWDTVVLQEQSTEPLPAVHGGNPASFQAGADGLQDLILAKNPAARVILYETWTSPTSAKKEGYGGVLQAMQNDLRDSFRHLQSRSTRTPGKSDYFAVAGVGDAFMRAVDQGYADPDPSDGIAPGRFYLWDTGDNRHAGKYGSYLSAAVFFGKITGLDPRTLAAGEGTAAAELGISPAHAKQLHQIAYEIVAPAAGPIDKR